jgi:hypothetical protein
VKKVSCLSCVLVAVRACRHTSCRLTLMVVTRQHSASNSGALCVRHGANVHTGRDNIEKTAKFPCVNSKAQRLCVLQRTLNCLKLLRI